MNQLKATVTIHGKIECVTGLHIGGSGSGYEIGGMDNPVIRNPRDGFPYIPGSSLKGKMRSLMEWAEGKAHPEGKIYHSSDKDDVISRIFGAPAEADRKAGPTRLIVRDAVPDEQTRRMMEELEATQGLPKVEVKTEVNINRITSKPLSGPRQMERVPAGSRFDFEIVYAIYDVDGLAKQDVDLLDKVFTALRLVEDSALGGSGSRGSGQVRFLLGAPLVRRLADYQQGTLQEPDRGKLDPLSSFGDGEINRLKERLR
ncbi:MAG TPA: type III-A CRISPR-associated RAMP protein Csm3 [Blastocatellia bacterium]|nr:type III-A CRISPR-associated RAMP protein Csm3 [Blastocatellia bacterium]